jgi:hypothetical protein
MSAEYSAKWLSLEQDMEMARKRQLQHHEDWINAELENLGVVDWRLSSLASSNFRPLIVDALFKPIKKCAHHNCDIGAGQKSFT